MLRNHVLGWLLVVICTAPVVSQEVVPDRDPALQQDPAQRTESKVDRISSNRLLGQNILFEGTEDVLGTINDIVLQPDGKALYAIVGAGGVIGIGQTEHAVPTKALSLNWQRDGEQKSVRVSLEMTEKELRGSPKLTMENAQDLTEESFVARNAEYFKAQGGDAALEAEKMLLVSELTNLQVMGKDNERIGVLDAIIFGEDCTGEFFILGSGGTVGIGKEYTAVPFGKVKIDKTTDGQYRASLAADETKIAAAPKVTPDEYKELDDQTVRENIEEAFGEIEQ